MYRDVVYLLKPRLPWICICMYQIIFLCSSNVFHNFLMDDFFFQICFLPNTKNEKLRTEIIQLYYDVLILEYKGKQKMTDLVTRNYWWLGVTKDIRKYINGCDLYQRIKNRIEILTSKLMENEILEKLQMYLMINFIMKLLLITRKDIILISCNRLSKIAYFMTMTEEALVEGLTRLFRNNIQKLHRYQKV